MNDWMMVRQLYAECSRERILRQLFFSNLLNLSGLVLGVYLLLAVVGLMMVMTLLPGWWAAPLLIALVAVFSLVGSLVLEERAHVVYPDHFHQYPELLSTYRRGFLGLRYVELVSRLRTIGRFQVQALEAALRCCDAEVELARQMDRPRGWGGVVLLSLIAAGLAAGAPWLVGWGVPGTLLYWVVIAAALVAMLRGAVIAVQPKRRPEHELRCLLVWALEEARADTPS
ncbi:MAG: hypothetical protein JJU08_10655 [Rhodobacteraceae bacterium]|nr:hypothetical protein [Paracoccaceae bacterium]